MRIERRVERMARRLAGEDAGFVRQVRELPTGSLDSAFDGLARAMATPVSRRRALTVAGGAVAAASLLRPGQAKADCWPGGPKVCQNSHGAKVCVPSNLACCSNENCGIACPYPWRICESPAVCSDTSSMCTTYATDKTRSKFCSQRVSVTVGCLDSGSAVATRGWCCMPSETCGSDFGQCVCVTPCGSDCCKSDEECVSAGFLRGSSCLKKCPPGWHHDGVDCVCDNGQTCGLRCCRAGTVCENNRCVSPPPPGKLPGLFDAFSNFGDTANQSAAAHGGHARDRASAAAGTPVGAALLLLAAVNAQGAAAGVALGETNVDRAYRRKVAVPRPSVPRLQSGTGLDPRAASALQTLLTAEAQGFAYVFACATALARARGALKHHDSRAARKQVLAAAGFADKAARSLRRAPSLRAAAAAMLTSTGTVEVTASPAEVSALQGQVRAGGVPADLRAALTRLGVPKDELGRVRQALLVSADGGPVLIAPLLDSARTTNLRAMAGELAALAKRARRQPIARSRPQPRRFRQHGGG